MFSQYIRKLGNGALLYALADVIAGLGLTIIIAGLFGYSVPDKTIKLGFALILAGSAIGVIGVYLMRDAAKRIQKPFYELSGFSTGYTLLFLGTILALLDSIVAMIGSSTGLVYLGNLLSLIGLILIGTRTKKLGYLRIDYGSGPSLILLGAILMLFGIGALIVRIGFLVLGLKFRGYPQNHPEIVNRVAHELEQEMIDKGTVNLVEFASSRGYPLHLVLDAAYAISVTRGYRVINLVISRV